MPPDVGKSRFSTVRTTRACWSNGFTSSSTSRLGPGATEEIRDFEDLLCRNGTTILKFFLHISKEEQLARFAQRLEDPGHNWKISEADYTEREFWDDYIEAFEDAIRATSAREAPWYVIPVERQMVPESRGVANHRRRDGRSRPRLPAALG